MPVEHLGDKVVLRNNDGGTVTVLLYGATVISWKSPSIENAQDIKERLFLSSKALLNGTKPVRGGIPVVFPCFGAPVQPEHLKLAQHGFARSETWYFDSTVMDNEAGVSVRFVLKPNPSISSVYDLDFELAYVVTLAAHQLSTDLHVKNTNTDKAIDFQALLHTYYAVPANEVAISPLKDLPFYDKTELDESSRRKTEDRESVDVRKYTDAVYENGPGKYNIVWDKGAINIRAVNFKDLVVWNPQEEGAKIGDMEENGWNKYVCVEPGYVNGYVQLQPGETWTGQQVITIQK